MQSTAVNLEFKLLICNRSLEFRINVNPRLVRLDAFNTTSRYLDDILNFNNVCFDTMVSQIYPSELQLKVVPDSPAYVQKSFIF